MYRGINDFKKGYQPRTYIVKDEKGDLIGDSHRRNYFSQLFNVNVFNDVRQTEIHTTETLMPEPSAFEFELANEKLKSHKSPDIDQIPEDLIKAVDRTIRHEIHKLIISIWNKDELSQERKESNIVPIYRNSNKTYCNNYRGISLLPICQCFIAIALQISFRIRHYVGLKLNDTHQFMVYANDANILGGRVYNTKENAKALLVANK